MSLTHKQAIDDIQTMFLNAITPSGVQVHWENVRDQRDPSEDPWVQFMIRHAFGSQASLGGVGNRDFERQGVAVAAVFVPIGKGLSESYSLAKTIIDAYEGVTSPNGVWFRNSRIQEIGRDGEFHQTQVLVDFFYYETK